MVTLKRNKYMIREQELDPDWVNKIWTTRQMSTYDYEASPHLDVRFIKIDENKWLALNQDNKIIKPYAE